LLATFASSAPDGSPDVRRNRPSGRPGLLACPRPRAFRHSRPDSRLAASTLLPLLPGVASPPFSGHGVHWGAVPAALVRDPSLNGVAPAGVLSSPARVDSPPVALGRRTDRLQASLLRYRIASLRRMPAAPCRPGVPTARTIPLWRLLRPTTPKPWSRRPCGFRASRLACKGEVTCARLSSRETSRLRRRPRGSFVAGVLQTAHVPGPRPGCSRGLAGVAFASPAAPVGFAATLRSVVPTPRVSAPRRRLGPTCRFARPDPPRVPSTRDPLLGAGRRIAGPRLLGFGPGGQSCRASWRPRHGFVNRVDRARRPGLPWVLPVLFQVFGCRPLTAASGGRPPVGFSPHAVAT